MITHEELVSSLRYDKYTGDFFWLKNNKNHIGQGTKAGNLSKRGYIVIRVLGKLHRAHRLAWLYVHKSLPNGEIDHKNHIKNDNRISNLRVVDRVGQNRNATIRKDNVSGYAGICFHKRAKKWQATIGRGQGVKHLGYFIDLQDAIAARKKAEIDLGYYKN